MIVRLYTDKDFKDVKRLHALSGLDYDLPPNLSGSDFISARVVEDDGGIGMFCFLRRTAEAYLIVNGDWKSPGWRNEAIRKLHYKCNDDAKKAGIVDIIAFLPPDVGDAFGRRLMKFGWSKCKDDWKAYCIGVS